MMTMEFRIQFNYFISTGNVQKWNLCFSGVLMLSYELNNKDLKLIVNAFDKTCEKVSKAIKSKNYKEFLKM